MGKWWVATFGWFLAVWPLQAAYRVAMPLPRTPEIRAAVTDSHDLVVLVRPHEGDAWTRLAKRLTGDATRWTAIALRNGDAPLRTGREVEVEFTDLRPELQREAIEALFPGDERTTSGWLHVAAIAGSPEAESLWKISEWFTGKGENYRQLKISPGSSRLSTRRGDRVEVPGELLIPALRPVRDDKSAPGPGTSRDSSTDGKKEPDITQRAAKALELPSEPSVAPLRRAGGTAPKPSSESRARLVQAVETGAIAPVALEYETRGDNPHAVYRLKKGEALYSSVAIRFTGRVYVKDVNEAIDEMVRFNGIADVSRMPVGFPVKIPLTLLTPEFRPPDDPERLEREEAKREIATLSRRVEAENLAGVHVVLDAGHGGRDVGTAHDDVWESIYVYDVACRLKKILEERSEAVVSLTTRSARQGFRISDRDVLKKQTDHLVLTSPHYVLDDAIVGVNLRWYLANSVLRKAMSKHVPPEKVIFISIHADSLHPSLRGSMAYIPGQKFATGEFRRSGKVYLARSEVRESPSVKQTREDALVAEGQSRELAQSVIASIAGAGLAVHPFSPIRDNVIRDGREWVPAVIRFNKVPARILLEVCNLGNDQDRSLIKTKAYRQQIAAAVYEGVRSLFASRVQTDPAERRTQSAAR